MSESESKRLDGTKCPDCGKDLRDADTPCAHCRTPTVEKSAEEITETTPDNEKKRKPPRFSKPRILLIGVMGLALIAALSVGLFYFLEDSTTRETGETGSSSVTETSATETDADEENQEQEENSDSEVSLEDVLAAHYQNCQLVEGVSAGQPIVGYQNLQSCIREGANEEEAPAALQIYMSESPDEAVAFAAARIFCTDALGNELFVLRGEQFLIMPIVPLDSQVVAEVQDPLDVFTPEYVQTFNDMSKREQSFLKDKGLESELINACEELKPS